MKKLSFLTVVAGTMMLASCSNDAEVITSVEGGEGVQQIVLQVASNGDGLTTRAGRELLSEEAKQEIDVVDLYIVDENGAIAYALTGIDWTDANEVQPYEIGNNGKGTMTTITLEKNEKLGAGTYTIYALGHSSSSDYKIPTYTTETPKDDVKLENLILPYSGTGSNIAEEIFAGSTVAFTLEGKDSFSKTIVLHRQVAGTYGYFYKLPYVDGMGENTTLTLYTESNLNTELVLGNFFTNTQGELQNNGGNADAKYVVNGANASTSKEIYSITLSDWFGEIKKDGNFINTENWNKPEAYSNVRLVQGSVFASTFVIPFAKAEDTNANTLVLKLENRDESGNVTGNALKTWKIKLGEKDPQIGQTVYSWTGNGFPAIESEETVTSYSIVRNHLYTVGKKLKATDPDNPDDPENPTDDDEPEDLSKAQDLILKVNHNWEVFHKMVLEEE